MVEECDLYDLCTLNGTHLETSSPGHLTSGQPTGELVVDYAIISASLLPMVQKFYVELPAEDEDNDWADYVRICIMLDSKVFEYVSLPAREGREVLNFAGSEYVDQLYQETMGAKETKDEALESLWGPVLCVSSPTHIYVEEAAAKGNKTGASGAGIYLGPGSHSNSAVRVCASVC
jgi:hypothetical protein